MNSETCTPIATHSFFFCFAFTLCILLREFSSLYFYTHTHMHGHQSQIEITTNLNKAPITNTVINHYLFSFSAQCFLIESLVLLLAVTRQEPAFCKTPAIIISFFTVHEEADDSSGGKRGPDQSDKPQVKPSSR